MIDLKNKVAVVTGASRGIGLEIARTLASLGARVALISTREREELASQIAGETGSEVKSYACDVSDSEQVASTFKAILEAFGQIDILVNNAGITRDRLVLAMKEQDFDDVIAVNLKGAFNLIKQVYPVLARKRSGRIINISSVAGLCGNPGQINYSASKAGLIAMTKTVAKELAARGVTCNAIAPGFVETDMTKDIAQSAPLADAIPMKRFAKPEEIAALASFLASDSAAYITGEVIRCDGGLAM